MDERILFPQDNTIRGLAEESGYSPEEVFEIARDLGLNVVGRSPEEARLDEGPRVTLILRDHLTLMKNEF